MSEDRVRVLFILRYFYPFIGGTEKQALTLASHLVQKGVKVTIVTSRREKLWSGYEPICGVEVMRLWSPKVKVLGAIVFLMQLTFYLLKRRKFFSVLQTFQIGYTSSLSIFLGNLLRIPTVIKLASSGWGGDVKRSKKSMLGRIDLFIAKRASHIIVLNTEMESELRGEGFCDSKLSLIRNGVDLKRCRDGVSKITLRKQLNIPNKKTIIFTGRLSYEKGVDVLVNSFSLVVREIVCQLLIIADGSERDNICRIIDQHGLSEHVLLLKEVVEVEQYLKAADLFVLPSRFEGLSNSLLEAMSCGLPVISTRVGGSLDLIRDGVNGLLVEVADEMDLAKKMLKVLNDEILAELLGSNAKKTIFAHYNITDIAERYLQLYKDLLVDNKLIR